MAVALPGSGDTRRHTRPTASAAPGPGAEPRPWRARSPAAIDGRRRRQRPDARRPADAPRPAAHRDLDRIFDDVLDHSVALFGADKAGLWTVEDGDHPFRLAAHRGLGPAFLAAVARGRAREPRRRLARGRRAPDDRPPAPVGAPARRPSSSPATTRRGSARSASSRSRTSTSRSASSSLYHTRPYDWATAELDLVESFADQVAVALQNARLYASVRAFAARLDAIQDLAARLNRLHDQTEIGQAIVAEVRGLFASDTARVYRSTTPPGCASRSRSAGIFLGRLRPVRRRSCASPIGHGLTGWVAAHNTPLRVADARTDPRRLMVGPDEEPESMLVAPMTFEDVVRGVIVVARRASTGTSRTT